MRTIEIDFDVHKKIELERKSFDDSPNSALRRLLGLPEVAQTELTSAVGQDLGWQDSGPDGYLTLPNGTRLQMTYNGRTHEGVIEKGVWLVEGKEYGSPSGAAEGVARTKNGTTPKLNGWTYWRALLPGTSEWVSVNELSKVARVAYQSPRPSIFNTPRGKIVEIKRPPA